MLIGVPNSTQYIEITENEITAKAKNRFPEEIHRCRTNHLVHRPMYCTREGRTCGYQFGSRHVRLCFGEYRNIRFVVEQTTNVSGILLKVDYCRRHAKKEITVKKDRSAGKSFTSWVKEKS
ncbi:hypothetical protein K435DRAFT_851513 [Dendrothele bispora CBS 962.96]|uniref:Uncharacterized protein n=1 Tax=Dendrothele bispora (strain CBS 962.96) TaxID=1314807 RepID=A0A4V4HHR3_DENBC|nr:hypothetical protein K435DRAFT_851513 [Dendrothele bispora CBS 962.96]